MYRFFATLLAFLLALASPTHADPGIRACYEDKGWDLYVLGESEAIPPKPGILIDLINSVAAESGQKFHLQRRPWKRCLALLENAAVDAVIGGSYLPERALYARYPEEPDGSIDQNRALHSASYYLFTRRDSIVIWDGTTLSGLQRPLGVDLGYSIGRVLKDLGYDINEFADIEQGLMMVQRGRLDGYVTFETDAEPHLSTGRFDLIKHTPPYQARAYYVMFSRPFYNANTAKVETFWNDLARLRPSLLPGLEERYRDLSK